VVDAAREKGGTEHTFPMSVTKQYEEFFGALALPVGRYGTNLVPFLKIVLYIYF